MAIKAVNATQLDTDLASIADAIRAKTGLSDELLFPDEFVSAIGSITTGGGGTGSGIQTASTTVSNANAQYIQFNSIREVPDWFVLFADPAAATDYGTTYWYYTTISKSNNTISAVVAKAVSSGGVSTDPKLALDIKASGINAQYTTIPIGLKISGSDYFLRNTKYTIFYGSGSGSGSGGTGGITPSGNKAITASTSVQSNIDVTQYATVSVSPTPTESKTVTLGANAPSAVTPSSGKHLSQVGLSLDTSVFKAENIASGVTMLGVTGTHTGGGGSSGGGGNISQAVNMSAGNTPTGTNGYWYYRSTGTLDTTNLIGFFAVQTDPIIVDDDIDADGTIYYLTALFWRTLDNDGTAYVMRKMSNGDVRLETKAISSAAINVNVTSGTSGKIEIQAYNASGNYYMFSDNGMWKLYPIYSS